VKSARPVLSRKVSETPTSASHFKLSNVQNPSLPIITSRFRP